MNNTEVGVEDMTLRSLMDIVQWVSLLLFRSIQSDEHTLVLFNNVEIKMKGDAHGNL